MALNSSSVHEVQYCTLLMQGLDHSDKNTLVLWEYHSKYVCDYRRACFKQHSTLNFHSMVC